MTRTPTMRTAARRRRRSSRHMGTARSHGLRAVATPATMLQAHRRNARGSSRRWQRWWCAQGPHRPCTTRTLSRPRSSRTCPADTPRSAHCRPLLQSVPFCRARTLRGHRWSAGCGDQADRGGSVGQTRANAAPPRTCGSQTAASAAAAAAAAAASAGSAMEEGRAKIRMGQVVGAGAAAVRARAGLQVAAFPVAAAGKG
jgi:hypothetical protein